MSIETESRTTTPVCGCLDTRQGENSSRLLYRIPKSVAKKCIRRIIYAIPFVFVASPKATKLDQAPAAALALHLASRDADVAARGVAGPRRSRKSVDSLCLNRIDRNCQLTSTDHTRVAALGADGRWWSVRGVPHTRWSLHDLARSYEASSCRVAHARAHVVSGRWTRCVVTSPRVPKGPQGPL